MQLVEKRRVVACDRCGCKMVFAGEILKSKRSSRIYLKYLCPRRAEEPGCGLAKMIRLGRSERLKLKAISDYLS